MKSHTDNELFPIMWHAYSADITSSRLLRNAEVGQIVIGVPWGMIKSHEKQAMENHSQSLARLWERGGLSASEAVAVLEDRQYERMSLSDAQRRLANLVKIWTEGQCSASSQLDSEDKVTKYIKYDVDSLLG